MGKEHESQATASHVEQAIAAACSTSLGVLDSRFLCQSVGTMNPRHPVCVTEEVTIAVAIGELQRHKIGAVVVLDSAGRVSGIFTERDCILKVVGAGIDAGARPVTDVMTRDPVCEGMQATMAYLLMLMSQGGFRHIPIVDEDRRPVGILSVKDVVDRIVQSVQDELLAFPTSK